jgi:uncharacterized protein (UPF0332 family)
MVKIVKFFKAVRACISARVLLDLGDVDGACNRAYYAMFDAARAALLASGALVQIDPYNQDAWRPDRRVWLASG